MNANSQQSEQLGAEKIIFTACHSDKLKPAFTSAAVISTSPKKVLTSSIDFTFPLSFDRGKLKRNSLARKQNPLALGYRTLLSLHAGEEKNITGNN